MLHYWAAQWLETRNHHVQQHPLVEMVEMHLLSHRHIDPKVYHAALYIDIGSVNSRK